MVPMAVRYANEVRLVNLLQVDRAGRVAAEPRIEIDLTAARMLEAKAGVTEEFDGEGGHDDIVEAVPPLPRARGGEWPRKRCSQTENLQLSICNHLVFAARRSSAAAQYD